MPSSDFKTDRRTKYALYICACIVGVLIVTFVLMAAINGAIIELVPIGVVCLIVGGVCSVLYYQTRPQNSEKLDLKTANSKSELKKKEWNEKYMQGKLDDQKEA
jgi:predicted membrane channel-forming protein YqfA (hemolysin III family)